MDSFAKIVKDEIIHKQFSEDAEKILLAGFIQFNGIWTNNCLIINSHYDIIKFIYKLLRTFYKIDVNKEISAKAKNKKIKFYRLSIEKNNIQIYNDLLINNFDLVKKNFLNNQICKRAYIAGAFLACGSINSPKTTNYHLEITNSNFLAISFLKKLLKSFNFKFKTIIRSEKKVLYLKNSLAISDFLKLIDSSQAVFYFENERISRDMFNSINRLNNIEISNQQKVIIAGLKQIKMINFLKKNDQFNWLSLKAQRIANLRLKNPEYSLNELCVEYEKKFQIKISKSGMNHVFREIRDTYLKSKVI